MIATPSVGANLPTDAGSQGILMHVSEQVEEVFAVTNIARLVSAFKDMAASSFPLIVISGVVAEDVMHETLHWRFIKLDNQVIVVAHYYIVGANLPTDAGKFLGAVS